MEIENVFFFLSTGNYTYLIKRELYNLWTREQCESNRSLIVEKKSFRRTHVTRKRWRTSRALTRNLDCRTAEFWMHTYMFKGHETNMCGWVRSGLYRYRFILSWHVRSRCLHSRFKNSNGVGKQFTYTRILQYMVNGFNFETIFLHYILLFISFLFVLPRDVKTIIIIKKKKQMRLYL